MVEAALVTPILLMILLGLVESGNALSLRHKMAVLSREGANLASRGTSLEETLNVVLTNGDEIGLSEQGGAIVTRVVVTKGIPLIDRQVASPGYDADSRLGLPDSTVVPLGSLDFEEGQVLHAVEIIIRYESMTPVGGMLPEGFARTVYDRAIF